MRTFIAIDVPADMKDGLAAVARSLQGVVEGRFVPRTNYHMTLAFLGDTPQAMIEYAQVAMDHAVKQTDSLDGINLKADRLGIFGRKSNATLWMGFAKDPKLMELAIHLREQLDQSGFALDDKSFLPHVTLARHAKLPRGHLPNIPFPDAGEAGQLTLFKSELHSDGATYEPLYSIPLYGLPEVYGMKYPTDSPESMELISDVERYIDEVFIDDVFESAAYDGLFEGVAFEEYIAIPEPSDSPSFQATEYEDLSKPTSKPRFDPSLAQADYAELTGSFAPVSADAAILASQATSPAPQSAALPQASISELQGSAHPQAAPLPQAAAPLDLAERLENLDESFARTVLRLIDESGMDDVKVYKRANMSRQLFAKIRKDDNYRPTKKTACALAFALKLSHDDALALLSRAGFALSHSSKFDVIIEYFLINHIYDIHQINMTLYAFDQQILG